ncbi:MAG: hypothetical protein RLZZ206_4003 [Cyanobacteriota bacterium]|jgi:hypothetical protein
MGPLLEPAVQAGRQTAQDQFGQGQFSLRYGMR